MNEVGTAAPGNRMQRGGATLVAQGIFLSRIAGLVRERVFAHYFGNSMAGGVFKAALRIPNALQNLFGEGVLSASFIPVYAKLRAEGKGELADRVAGVVGSFLALFVGIVVALGMLFSPTIVVLIAAGFDGEAHALAVRLVRILFPGIGLLVMSAWCLGILNSHRRFFVSYTAPVLWSAAMIGAMVGFGGTVDEERLAVILAWGTVVGSALQFGVQLPHVFALARSLRFGFDKTLEPVRLVFRNAGPVIVGRGVVQVSAFVDTMIGSFLGAAAIAGIAYAQTLYMLPVSLFAMSIAAAELPEMAGAIGSSSEIAGALRARIGAAQRRVAFLVVPSLVAFLAIGTSLVGGLFETGRFGPDDTIYVTWILGGYAIGLLAVTVSRVYSSAFYALHDTRTPLRFAMIRVAVAILLGLAIAMPLRPWLVGIATNLGVTLPAVDNPSLAVGAVGLAFAGGIASWIELTLLRRALATKIGATPMPGSFLAKIWGAAIVAGTAGALFAAEVAGFVVGLLPKTFGLHRVGGAVAVAAVFGVVYLSTAAVLRVEEVGGVMRRLRRRG
ncbi:MAG: murein biosynthesis integral membrane protein MurJ [Acidobacteria bacterium]|nr:murein biosynthesis integral membrane protein MurJ [Acidobacteriota bacterium]